MSVLSSANTPHLFLFPLTRIVSWSLSLRSLPLSFSLLTTFLHSLGSPNSVVVRRRSGSLSRLRGPTSPNVGVYIRGSQTRLSTLYHSWWRLRPLPRTVRTTSNIEPTSTLTKPSAHNTSTHASSCAPLALLYVANMRRYIPALSRTSYIHGIVQGVMLPTLPRSAVHNVSFCEQLTQYGEHILSYHILDGMWRRMERLTSISLCRRSWISTSLAW